MNKYVKIKRDAQRTHFRRRALERLGYELLEREIARIRQQVRERKAELLTRPDAKLSVWRVDIGARQMVVVYDLETEELSTILTNKIWQEQDMCNSPYSKDEGHLVGTLGDHPKAKALAELKEKLGG